VVERLPSRPTNMSNLFSDTIADMETLLVKAKKVKRGSTLEEEGFEGAWLKANAKICPRSRDDRDLGVTGYPCELGPASIPFHRATSSIASGQSGLEWSRAGLRPIYEFEAHYVNSAGSGWPSQRLPWPFEEKPVQSWILRVSRTL
jgi:hypothetical protein